MIFVIFFQKLNFIKKHYFPYIKIGQLHFFITFQEFAYIQRQDPVRGRGFYIVSIKSYSNPKLLIRFPQKTTFLPTCIITVCIYVH